jgi:ribosomal protein S27E
MVYAPSHCPGFQEFKHLKSFTCRCPECGREQEIFSDEFDRERQCKGCGKKIDFSRCQFYAEGGTPAGS